jgi:hypothetical protein
MSIFLVFTVIALWMSVVRILRYKRFSDMDVLYKKSDWVRLHFVLTQIEMPWALERALELALLRTYSIPSISAVLARSGVRMKTETKKKEGRKKEAIAE